MFDSVVKKLERAEYCLNTLNSLAEEARGFAHIPSDKQQEMRASLDSFFFELVSAKDFFLQAINDHYKLGLKKKEATDIDRLKSCLKCREISSAGGVIEEIARAFKDKNSWQWRVNNYRNAATHRELLRLGYEINTNWNDAKVFLHKDPEDPGQGNLDILGIEVIQYCEESLENMRNWLGKLYSQLGISSDNRGAG